MDEDLKLNIYPIIQQQVSNIIKYAAASAAMISISGNKQAVKISIMDNGKAFDPSVRRKGAGISNIINRVTSFNGTIHIESSPGKSCTIDTEIPRDQ